MSSTSQIPPESSADPGPPFTREQQEAFETLDREICNCPVAGIYRRDHIELPIETALTLRSLIDNFRP